MDKPFICQSITVMENATVPNLTTSVLICSTCTASIITNVYRTWFFCQKVFVKKYFQKIIFTQIKLNETPFTRK